VSQLTKLKSLSILLWITYVGGKKILRGERGGEGRRKGKEMGGEEEREEVRRSGSRRGRMSSDIFPKFAEFSKCSEFSTF
jgi:hypothetical protein